MTSTADTLIAATLESIHRHGLDGTTVTTVTDLAGLSRGMVRHEFGSKQAMIVRTMERVCSDWTQATEPDPTLDGSAQVRAIVEAMFAPDVFQAPLIDAWLALSVAATGDDELRRLRDRAQATWTDQLEQAFVRAGVDDAGTAALGLVASADGLWLRHRLEGHSLGRADALAAAIRVADALLGS